MIQKVSRSDKSQTTNIEDNTRSLQVKGGAIIKYITAILEMNNPLGNTTHYIYNKKGEVIQVKTPLGDITTYNYNADGNITTKIDEFKTLYTYNYANKLTQVSYQDGNTVKLSYNALNQLTQIQDWLGTTTFNLDKLGRPISITDHNNNTVAYKWDSNNQKEEILYPNGNMYN